MFGDSKALELLGPVETAREANAYNDLGKVDSEKGLHQNFPTFIHPNKTCLYA